MNLELGTSYLTKSGNTLVCQSSAPEGNFWGVYTEVIEGHEALKGRQQLWTEEGSWVKHPGGIHDIVKKL
jgi:hypothetical protein